MQIRKCNYIGEGCSCTLWFKLLALGFGFGLDFCANVYLKWPTLGSWKNTCRTKSQASWNNLKCAQLFCMQSVFQSPADLAIIIIMPSARRSRVSRSCLVDHWIASQPEVIASSIRCGAYCETHLILLEISGNNATTARRFYQLIDMGVKTGSPFPCRLCN